MNTYDVHALFNKEYKKMVVGESIVETYEIWKSCFEGTSEVPDDFDAFVAGYIIGNNVILKEKVLSIKKIGRLIKNTFGGK